MNCAGAEAERNIKNQEQIQSIRERGKINIAILDDISENIRAGITTEQIDQWVYEQTMRYNAIPAPLNYEGFPKSVCASLNDQVCHGISSLDLALREGDIDRENGYSVVKEIGGHGVSLEFHEEPWVSYVSKKGTEMLMVPGMILTIEPMINMGTDEIYIDDGDGWNVYTADGQPSAQWEIQVLVTEEGYEILAYSFN